MSQILTGLGVGLNAVVAEVFQVAAPKALPAWAKSNAGVSVETESLKTAIASVASDLDSLAAKSDETSAEIFEALKYLLEDESLFDMAVVHLDEGWSAGAGYGMAVNEFAEMLAGDAAFRRANRRPARYLKARPGINRWYSHGSRPAIQRLFCNCRRRLFPGRHRAIYPCGGWRYYV